MADPLLIAKAGNNDLGLLPVMGNRHGLITGATGTGKTVTLQTMAEQFSRIGVPVFMADVKGDLSGIAAAGGSNPKVAERAKALGIELRYEACPVVFWDVFGKQGHPIRATVSDLGPLLLARLLDLNDTQAGVLALAFKVADDAGLLLLDIKDLRAMLQYVGEHSAEYTTEYGNASVASIGAIQRALLTLSEQGAEQLFGEPMLNIADLLQTSGGRGVVNILAADRLLGAPKLYATLLLWMLAELFEHLPEVGDPDKPKLVFFFDEAHLLFTDAPKPLLDKIEQVVRLIRSKGVGVYFVTQNPLDVPDTVLGQLGNRIQHALRAFTPRDQKAVKSAAETMRPNPSLKIEQAITELGVGEALVSLLDAQGRPGVTERALVVPPGSQIGPVDAATRTRIVASSPVAGFYEKAIDRESAYEVLKARTAARQPEAPPRGSPTGEAAPQPRQRAKIGAHNDSRRGVMSRTSLICVVALFLLEACTALGPGKSSLTSEQLINGAPFLWTASALPAVPSEDEAFGLDAEMRAFIAPLKAIDDPISRFTRLREAMQQRGLFSIVYSGSSTRTARQVFHDGQGNCLSFTMLFVALARGAGLEARFQLVDVPRTFKSEGGTLIVDTHVNAAVLAPFGRKFFVDFNTANFREKYPIHAISDRYALALFYNNLGAEALVRQEYPQSFAMLREAARTYADIPGTWVNLGVLYERHGFHEHAEAAQRRALAADPREQSALANLVAIYSALGEEELAEEYRQRIRRYRDANPYYHFGVAQAAYDQKRFADALTSVRSAIRLKRDDDEFYMLEGRVFTEIGRPDRAIASFARAKELAATRQ